VARAKLLGLQGELDAGPTIDGRANQVGPIPHHGNRAIYPPVGEDIEDMVDHGPPADGHQDLGQLGFHPRAHARGKNHGSCHVRVPILP
jgi:hypothetical protein